VHCIPLAAPKEKLRGTEQFKEPLSRSAGEVARQSLPLRRQGSDEGGARGCFFNGKVTETNDFTPNISRTVREGPFLTSKGYIMIRLLIVWILNAAALMTVAYLMPQITVTNFVAALMAAFALGFVNTLIRPVLTILTLPISVLTLGFFYLLLNGLLFWAVGKLLNGFEVSGFWAAVFGGLLYGLISWALAVIIPFGKKSKAK
jgi:putative membrane protein